MSKKKLKTIESLMRNKCQLKDKKKLRLRSRAKNHQSRLKVGDIIKQEITRYFLWMLILKGRQSTYLCQNMIKDKVPKDECDLGH